jgi:formylglycine-generating enzyme required for sulfatase activity
MKKVCLIFLFFITSTLQINLTLAQNSCEIIIFRDAESLTLYVLPCNPPVSIVGLTFQVTTSENELITHKLDDFDSFRGILFENLPTPICFRIVKFGSRIPVPLECPGSLSLHTQKVADVNLFWVGRLIQILGGIEENSFCPAEQSECKFTYTPPECPQENSDWVPVIENFDGMEMVLVPAGSFTMGSTQEQIDAAVALTGNEIYENQAPQTSICFKKPFWIGRFELTNDQFAQFNGQAAADSRWSGSTQPREQIQWTEARDFCQSRNMRLPTEAEWEYAARGPDNPIYPWGNTFSGNNVVYTMNSDGQTASVGSKPGGISWVGAHDMSGNVWEWVSTTYQPYPYRVDDGREDGTENDIHVIRGGAWNSSEVNLNSAVRFFLRQYVTDFNPGFRCVSDT